jgi:hypothetical protein
MEADRRKYNNTLPGTVPGGSGYGADRWTTSRVERATTRRLVMKDAIVLGAAALVASCVFAEDGFAQGSGEGSYRAVAPGHVGRPPGWSYAPCGGAASLG